MTIDTSNNNKTDNKYRINPYTAIIICCISVALGTIYHGINVPALPIAIFFIVFIGFSKEDYPWLGAMTVAFLIGNFAVAPVINAVNVQSFYEKPITINAVIQNLKQPSQIAPVTQLKAQGSGSISEICPDTLSTRGHLTISYSLPADDMVCCVVDEEQLFLPYKDVGDNRHYLCGNWPRTDEIIKPLSAVLQ